jgi:hypothetical protein
MDIESLLIHDLILFVLSYIIDDEDLCLGDEFMKYITPKEAGEKWGISDRRIQLLCKQGRIEGVYRLGWTWAIPEDAEKPADNRFKNCKKKEI